MKYFKLFLIGLLLPCATFSQELISVSPSSVNASGQTLDLIITGNNTHFDPNGGTTLDFQYYKGSDKAATLNSYSVLSPTALKANITIPSNAETGDYGIYVSNSQDGQMRIFSFHVNGVPPLPAISIGYQAEIVANKTMNVTIYGIRYPYGGGTHFKDPNGTNATKLTFKSLDPNSVNEIVVNSMTIKNDSTIIANITTTSQASAQTVCVTNNTDGKICSQFKVYAGCASYFTTSYDALTNVFTIHLDSLASASTSFSWNLGDGTLSNDPAPSHTYAKDSLYTVCLSTDSCWYCRVIGIDDDGNPVTRVNGFTLNVVPFKSTTTGIKLNENRHSLAVYPNPGQNIIYIETSAALLTSKSVLEIYSVEGKLLLQQQLVKEKTEVDLSQLMKGVYIIQVAGADRIERLKFIKE